uniref:FYVE-type domain-containing protein n=1 Tax=Caenorhabditis tropicalis TaxID=1561998 RepID=A0A1I7T041_9PELO
MNEVTDMDDLLDEMESDLMRKSRENQPPPPLLPLTSIAMQPRGSQKKTTTRHIVAVSKYTFTEDMNTEAEGHININSSLLPNTFQPKSSCLTMTDEKEIKTESILPKSNCLEKQTDTVPEREKREEEKSEGYEYESNHSRPLSEQGHSEDLNLPVEPTPNDKSEPEEVTQIPETQLISNSHATDREETDRDHNKNTGNESVVLDTEMESMLEYLNGVGDENVIVESISPVIPLSEETPIRKAGGRDVDKSEDEFLLAEFASRLTQEVMAEALSDQVSHQNIEESEQLIGNQTQIGENIDRIQSLSSSFDADTSDHLSESENVECQQHLPFVSEKCEQADNNQESSRGSCFSGEENDISKTEENLCPTQNEEVQEIISENNEAGQEIPLEQLNKTEGKSEVEENVIVQTSESDDLNYDAVQEKIDLTIETTEKSNVLSEDVPTNVIDTPSSDSQLQADSVPIATSNEESQETEDDKETETDQVVKTTTVELAACEERNGTVEEVVPGENPSSEYEENTEVEETRPRFDSSIATIHVLHESDSDESLPTRRERRLTESELQLGKTSPYWIPDSECPNCMLCNTKFTLITRRHHCRACGRVLCGSCCCEKAILEYLHEEGKKPQAVRVCKTCSSMLSRIEAHQQEEQRRRESIVSDGHQNEEDSSSSTPQPVTVPRGVLKTRSMTQSGEEESNSANSQIPSTSASVSESSRRTVMFRDGVRPGASVNEENLEEERSTALKPKRKRTSVVRRIAELRMEDELTCALPKSGTTKFLILKPDSEWPKLEDAHIILESLFNFSVVTVVLKKNLNCAVQIFNNPNFGLVWVVSTQGFSQIGLDELLFSWTLNDEEKQKVDAEEPELDEQTALSLLPLSVLHRISMIYVNSTEHEYAGVRRVDNRLMRVHTVSDPQYPLTKHVLFYRPTVQPGLDSMRIPTSPFVIACFLNDDELSWATALPNRLLYKLGEKYNVFPTPFVNKVGRPSLYSTDVSGTVLKVFTDFRSWSYRMKHIPGCTVSLTNDKTTIRIPRSCLKDLKDILNFSRSMVAWSCDYHQEDDSILICEETDPGLYSTQVFAKNIGQRTSTSASFVILDGGSKVNSLQVNVVEDGVAIRLQSERLETILTAINEGHDIVESSKDMEFRVEFVEDGDWIAAESDYYPKSQIDGLCLINKFQYGLSLERALTQVLQIQGMSDYGVRMSHVFNLGDGRLQPEEEPKIYGMVEVAARECVAMLESHIQSLIHSGIGSVSIRLFVSPYEIEYDVSRWIGLEAENDTYRQSLDQLIPMLCNMVEHIPNGFEVEFVLSFVSTKALPI